MRRASSASLSADRAEAATFTPCRASAMASARPMPVLAPVIQAVRHGAAMARVLEPVQRLQQASDEPRGNAPASRWPPGRCNPRPGSATGWCSIVSSRSATSPRW